MFKSTMTFMAMRCLRVTPLQEKMQTSTAATWAFRTSALPYSQLTCWSSCKTCAHAGRPLPLTLSPRDVFSYQPQPLLPRPDCHPHLALTEWTALCYKTHVSPPVVKSLPLTRHKTLSSSPNPKN